MKFTWMNAYAILLLSWAVGALTCAEAAQVRVDFVHPSPTQPFANDEKVLWYDNFDAEAPKKYHELNADNHARTITDTMNVGAKGKSVHLTYEKGKRGNGGRKLTFGDCPFGPPLKKGQKFKEIYWRIYVKHQAGWTGGGPDKMSRCTMFTSSKWTQGMIGHVWSAGTKLTLDPARGIKDGRVATTKYNDFPNLKWMGNKPASPFAMHADEQAGRWICVEAHVKLNTPGKKDGAMHLWVDGMLQCDRKKMDWRSTYTAHGINAVFLEAYWNKGSPVTQSRWMDEFVVSTAPIGPVVAAKVPLLQRTPASDGITAAWEAEVSVQVPAEKKDGAEAIFKRLPDVWGHQVGDDVFVQKVWSSKPVTTGLTVSVDEGHGTFAGEARLAASSTYFTRVREKQPDGTWGAWSNWHQPFRIAE